MITLESGGMSHSKKIAYSISKIPIHQNERKQTGPTCFLFFQEKLVHFFLIK
jgi:hypothetical protein